MNLGMSKYKRNREICTHPVMSSPVLTIPERLAATRQTRLGELSKLSSGMPKGNTDRELLAMFVESRGLLDTLKIAKTLFVEEVCWVKHIQLLQRWLYSSGKSETQSLDEVQEALSKRVFNLEATVLSALVHGNPVSAKSTTFENDLVNVARVEANTSFLFGVKCNSNDIRVAIHGMPVGEVRSLLPLTALECSILEHVRELTEKHQDMVLTSVSPDVRDFVRCIPSAAKCSIDQFYNDWVIEENGSLLADVPTKTSLSVDGKLCALDHQRLGQMARLILYFKDKYGETGLRVWPSMSDQKLLTYCTAPVSAGEILREVLYFDLQGDVNPFVFLAGNQSLCLEYARSVLNRVSKVIPRPPPISIAQDMENWINHEDYKKLPGKEDRVQVVDHVLSARFRVIGHKADPIESEWVCEDDVLQANFAVVNAIKDYKRTHLTFKGYELKE